MTPVDGAWSLHRRLGHARRAGPPGPDRQRPGQRVDARLQGRPHGPAGLRRAAARQPRHGRAPSAAQGTAVAGRRDRDRLLAPGRRARPASRWTSRSSARASSPSRPRRACATRATASSPPTPQGPLVTAQGDPVLGRGGRPLTVGADGRVDPRALGVVALDQPAQGRRHARHRHARGAPARGQVRAGALEGSGADAARSMVDMIASLRAFEAGQRVIQTIDETLGKAVDPGRHRSTARRMARPLKFPAAHADDRGRMLEGLNTAAAGMAAQQQRLDAVANDLANANTTGYKHVRVGFRDLVYRRRAAPGARACAPAPARPRSTPAAAFAQGALAAHRPARSTSPSRARASSASGSPTARQALTRDGDLQLDGRGRLATSDGALVQPADDDPRRRRRRTTITIGADGTVTRRRPRARPHRRRHRPLPAGAARRSATTPSSPTAASGARSPRRAGDDRCPGRARGLQRRRRRRDGRR